MTSLPRVDVVCSICGRPMKGKPTKSGGHEIGKHKRLNGAQTGYCPGRNMTGHWPPAQPREAVS